VTDDGKLNGFVPFYSGTSGTQSFGALLKEVRNLAGLTHGGWVKLPPPEAGTVKWKMIRPNPWMCDLLGDEDPRQWTCSLPTNIDQLDPKVTTCGFEAKCNDEHANAFRADFAVGALPCCPTPPFCAAPKCSQKAMEDYNDMKSDFSTLTCTKRSPAENLAYLKRADVWPAYHGFGGSFEMDTLKFYDILGYDSDITGQVTSGKMVPKNTSAMLQTDSTSLTNSHIFANSTDHSNSIIRPDAHMHLASVSDTGRSTEMSNSSNLHLSTVNVSVIAAASSNLNSTSNATSNKTQRYFKTAFDMVIDLGAGSGSFTEKLTARNFAKHYVMIEGNAFASSAISERLLSNNMSTGSWKQRFFSEQVPQRNGIDMPEYELISSPLRYHPKDKVGLCLLELSFAFAKGECMANHSMVDELIPRELSPKFQQLFADARSAFVKVDAQGMDELVLRGMRNLLKEVRGTYDDGRPRHLVNFLQFQFSPALMKTAKRRSGYKTYDLKTTVRLLEELGFEAFLVGPRFLPISHESWDSEFKTFTDDEQNNAGARLNYPDFESRLCPWCQDQSEPTMNTDIVAIRATHPRATYMKFALGACRESSDFDLADQYYEF